MSGRVSAAWAVAAVVGTSSLALACATSTRAGSAQITSADSLAAYRESEASADDLRRGRYDEALAHADHASRTAPDEGWARYDAAVALHHLGRTDAALASFRAAEARFAAEGDRRAQSLAVYGRARALTDAGRCSEANAAYETFAAMVSTSDPSSARLARAYAADCRPSEPVAQDPAMTEMVADLMTHDYEGALSASERVGASARASGWLDYNRAVALSALGRTDDAVRAYESAERHFATTDPARRGIAVYGRARALGEAKRCEEATAAYEDYAAMVRNDAPDDARMALTIARECTTEPFKEGTRTSPRP